MENAVKQLELIQENKIIIKLIFFKKNIRN